MKGLIHTWWLPVLLLVSGLQNPLPAQDELDLLQRCPEMPGTRAAALSGAFSGISDDYTGLFYNPAGLAGMRRLELSSSLIMKHQVNTVQLNGGNTTEARGDLSGLEHLGMALPLPAYRGGATLAAGYHRVLRFDQPFALRQSGEEAAVTEKGGVYASALGAGIQLSRHFWSGVTMEFRRGTEEYVFDLNTSGATVTEASKLKYVLWLSAGAVCTVPMITGAWAWWWRPP